MFITDDLIFYNTVIASKQVIKCFILYTLVQLLSNEIFPLPRVCKPTDNLKFIYHKYIFYMYRYTHAGGLFAIFTVSQFMARNDSVSDGFMNSVPVARPYLLSFCLRWDCLYVTTFPLCYSARYATLTFTEAELYIMS